MTIRFLWKFKNALKILKAHGHHFIFILSILALGSLVVWWSIFIRNSIQLQRLYHYDKLEADLKFIAFNLGTDGSYQPSAGVFKEDTRFEVIACQSGNSLFSRPLEPHWPELCLKVQADILGQIESKTRSLNLMLVGEASVLILIVLVSTVFLYRFIRLEKRTAREVNAFWERSAHEIKTPITGIKAFLENLRAGAVDSKKLAMYIDIALGQVERQEKLAENILSGYQLKRRELRLRFADLEMTDFFIDYFAKDSSRLAGAKIIFKFNKDNRMILRADVNALKVILDNITDNAVKYCASSPVLQVDCIGYENKAVIVIKDNGPGFPPHFIETIFEAYKHLDEELPVKRQGTGLGLYISRQLARKMGGDLEAYSEGEGQGAEFRIILPRINKK
jgi:signal transduction histidine kinase